MSKRKRRNQSTSRLAFMRTWPNGTPVGYCPACGKPGSHYCPPGFGDEGFFICTQYLLDGKAVDAEAFNAQMDAERAAEAGV
jgi:hypothetical protein